MRCGLLGAILIEWNHMFGGSVPRFVNVTASSVDRNTPLSASVSDEPTQISPVGPTSTATRYMFEMLPGSLGGSCEVGVVKLHPPSWLARSPWNVVARIAPVGVTA